MKINQSRMVIVNYYANVFHVIGSCMCMAVRKAILNASHMIEDDEIDDYRC